MKILRIIILEILFLMVMLLCGTLTIKILDTVFQFKHNNIIQLGFQVGFIAWLVFSICVLCFRGLISKN